MVWVLEKWDDTWRCENLVDEEHGLYIIYDNRFPGIIMYTLACSLAFANTQLKDDISNFCLMNVWGWATTAAAAMCGRLVCHVWEHRRRRDGIHCHLPPGHCGGRDRVACKASIGELEALDPT